MTNPQIKILHGLWYKVYHRRGNVNISKDNWNKVIIIMEIGNDLRTWHTSWYEIYSTLQ